jgi:hypothetical protein
VPVTIGELFPATDVVARWVFNLSVLTDDMSTFDALIFDAMDSDAEVTEPLGTYFRWMVTRVFEAERVVKAMDEHVAVAEFLRTTDGTIEAETELRAAYRRVSDDEGGRLRSEVDRRLGNARHLTVHLSNTSPTSRRRHERGELARILRHGEDLEARVAIDHINKRRRYLWGDDVLQQWVWPDEHHQLKAVVFTHRLTQTFVALYTGVLPVYLRRVGVDWTDLAWVDMRTGEDAAPPSRYEAVQPLHQNLDDGLEHRAAERERGHGQG